MVYKNTAFFKRLLFVNIVLFCLVCLGACSQSPISLLKQAAGEATFIDIVKVDRHRRFIIPTLSHIGLVVMPVKIGGQPDSLNTQLFTSVSEESGIMFNRAFSAVTLLGPNTRPDVEVDFIIRTSLLDASAYFKVIADDKASSLNQTDGLEKSNRSRESNRLQRRLRPYHALLKLELLDARSGLGVKATPMDIAIIKARSGALGSAQFKSLLRQGFAAYSKDITTTMRTTY